MGLVCRSSSSADHHGHLASGCVIDVDFDLEVNPLVCEEHMAEVEEFLTSYPDLTKDYIPIAVIGEGTFSTVFKAIDVNYWARDNSHWNEFSRQDTEDPSKIYSHFSRICNVVQTRSTKRALSSPLNQAIKNFILSQYFGISCEGSSGGVEDGLEPEHLVDLEELRSRLQRFPPHCVAIKRINSTSGPKRIAQEMSFLGLVGGHWHVIPIISGMRHEDQVLMIFPYFRGEDFREVMLNATATDIADYMKLLLEALAHLHRSKLIHRDVKPSNFLFSRKTATLPAAAVLVDFGLAQMEDRNGAAGSAKPKTVTPNTMGTISRFRTSMQNYPPGYFANDPRQPMRASRAGTRGFRAPEVLFKIAHQSTLIDVWSAGVILLTLLTKRYPFFLSNDDQDAIVEIALIFGNKELAAAAKIYNRSWNTNIPSIPPEHLTFRRLVKRLAPEVFVRMPDEVFDLLEHLLKLDSAERYSAEQALQHPFIIKHASC